MLFQQTKLFKPERQKDESFSEYQDRRKAANGVAKFLRQRGVPATTATDGSPFVASSKRGEEKTLVRYKPKAPSKRDSWRQNKW